MNSIIKSRTTENRFRFHGILPDSWGIPDKEKDRIKRSRVGILSITSPAGTLPVNADRPINNLGHLVTVNISLLEHSVLSARQMISIILHELGHVFNLPKPRDEMDAHVYNTKRSQLNTSFPCDKEVYADDYARHCGYGNDFAEALTIMKNLGEFGFDSPTIQTRIDRLRNPDEELLLTISIV